MVSLSDQIIQSSLNRMDHFIQSSPIQSGNVRQRCIIGIKDTLKKLNSEATGAESEHSKQILSPESLKTVSHYMNLALKTFQGINTSCLMTEQRLSFMLALSETYLALGEYKAALQSYADALEMSVSTNQLPVQGKIKFKMAKIYSDKAQWAKAETTLDEAIAILESSGNYGDTALARIELAEIAYRKGEYRQARAIFQGALKNTEQVNDTHNKALINNKLGVIQRIEKQYDAAFRLFQESLIQFQSIQDCRGAADSLNNLGVMHLMKKELPQAKVCFEKAFEMSQESADFPLLAFVFLNKAEWYFAVEDYAMAISMCSRGLEHFVHLRNPVGIAKCSLVFARIFWKLAEYQASGKFFEESLYLYDELKIPLGSANCCNEFSKMLREMNREEEADEYFSRAAKIRREMGMQAASDETLRKVTLIDASKAKTSGRATPEVISIKNP